jgi:tRNA (cmo5U34)-methyltransferase
MDSSNRDNLFAQPMDVVSEFTFDQSVAEVFQDMAQRSIPGYQAIIHHTGELAARFVQKDTNCYDLGCSLGASTLSVRQRIEGRDVALYAVDNSRAMLKKCAANLASEPSTTRIELVHEDICEVEINNASLVIMNFTLQFIPLEQRTALLSKIYAGLNPGGCLIASEKLHFEPAPLNHLLNELHHQFKRDQGYSDLEISQKRDAIENVLVPETLETHISRLQSCGFKTVSPWYQCFNFGSLVAIK